MKIGLFTDQYYPSISGVVTSIKMLYEGLEKMGHECFIFTSFDESQVDNKEELAAKKVINFDGKRYPFKAIKDYRFTFNYNKSIKIIAQYNLDIIHVHTEYNIAKIAMKASKRLGIPIVHTLHTSWKDYINYLFPTLDKNFHNQLLWLEKKIFTEPISKASIFDIVPTKKVLGDLEIYGMNGEVKVVPTGIELDRFYSENYSKDDINNLRVSLGLTDKFVFGYVGRTSKEKNIPTIIKSFAEAFKNSDDVSLLIVGGGPELPELKAEVKKYGIEDQVLFTDLVAWDKVPLYYQIFDIFVNASSTETQGLTYIEALSSNLPVLVKKDECIEDFIKEGYNGFYFDTPEELVLKMKYIYENKNTLPDIKKNTYKSIKMFSKEEYSKNILIVYEEAIKKYKEHNPDTEKVTA